MSNLGTVARLAGVSASTVSRTLARPEKVAEETRSRVMQAVAQVGYQPNELARGLRQQGGRSIGLIVSDLLNPFDATLAKGVQDAATHHDLTVFLFNSDESAEQERRALETLRGHLPQGLIIVPTAYTREHARLLSALPVVELDRSSGLEGMHNVQVDNLIGAQGATRHLTELGHRRIGLIVGQLDVSTSVERLEGYQAALSAAGLLPNAELTRVGHYHEEDGLRAATELLSLPPQERPTALFVGNNEMTVGAVLAARALGLRVPGDLSIIGFDDSRLLQVLQPAISVVAQPTYDLGFVAGETLISLLRRGTPSPPTSVRLATKLIIRESTAPPNC